MKIEHYKAIEIKHYPNILKERNFQYLFANNDGEISILNEKFEKTLQLTLEQEQILDVDLIPNKKLIVYSTGNFIKVIDYNKNEIINFQIKNDWVSVQNNLLWVVSFLIDKEDNEYLKVSIFETKAFKKIHSLRIDDDNYFDASVTVHKGFDNNTLILSISQGQDGYWNLLLKLEDNKLTSEFIGDDFIYPIVFNETGSLFVWVDDLMLDVLSYPDENIISNLDFDDYDLDFISNYHFLNNRNILLLAESGLYVYDIDAENITEIIIKNFESIVKSYDNSSLEDSTVSYFRNLKIFNDIILLTYKRENDYGVLKIDKKQILNN